MSYLTKDFKTRGLHETPLPITLDPAAHQGAFVLADDGLPYISDGGEWRPVLTDEFGDVVLAALATLSAVAGQTAQQSKEANEFAASGSPRTNAALAVVQFAQGQIARESARTRAQSEANTALREIMSVLGQVHKRIDGGRVKLNEGSADEPAVSIGSIGVYAPASDELAVVISGTEVARLTPSGLTINGTITESP